MRLCLLRSSLSKVIVNRLGYNFNLARFSCFSSVEMPFGTRKLESLENTTASRNDAMYGLYGKKKDFAEISKNLCRCRSKNNFVRLSK